MAESDHFIVSTTPTLEGRTITAYLGVVTGDGIGAAELGNLLRNFGDAIGNPKGYIERFFHEARTAALWELQNRAAHLGADAIVGVSLDHEFAHNGGGVLVTATGTAVRLD